MISTCTFRFRHPHLLVPQMTTIIQKIVPSNDDSDCDAIISILSTASKAFPIPSIHRAFYEYPAYSRLEGVTLSPKYYHHPEVGRLQQEGCIFTESIAYTNQITHLLHAIRWKRSESREEFEARQSEVVSVLPRGLVIKCVDLPSSTHS